MGGQNDDVDVVEIKSLEMKAWPPQGWHIAELSALISKILLLFNWRTFWEPTTEFSVHFLVKIHIQTVKYHCKLQDLCLSLDQWKNSTVKEGQIVGSAVWLYRLSCSCCQLLSQLDWLTDDYWLLPTCTRELVVVPTAPAQHRNDIHKVQTESEDDDGEERILKENKSGSQAATKGRALTA